MKELLVLGIGNRLMMDDGIGVHVVEELKRRNTNPDIRYVIGETDIYFCFNQMEETLMIFIVDAAFLDKESGGISVVSLEQICRNPIPSISVHEFHLFNEIKMTGKRIEGMFIGIEPYEINYSPSLSQVLQPQFLQICGKIEGVIGEFLLPKNTASHDK